MLMLIWLVCITLCIFLALSVLLRSSFRHLPGPTFRQYLPYGDVFPLYKDSSKMQQVIVALSKKYGRVFQLWLGPLDTVVTTVPSDIAQILATTRAFERPKAMHDMFEAVVPNSLMCIPRHMHTAARKHFGKTFNHTLLRGFHSEMNRAVLELCDFVEDLDAQTPQGERSPAFNVAEVLAMTVFRIITNVAFGCNLDREKRLYFAKCTDLLVDEMMLDFIGYPFRRWFTVLGFRNRLFEASRKVNEFCHRFIEARLNETRLEQHSRPTDLLDAIIALEGADLTKATSQAVVFAVAGAHTTTETLAWSIYETCCNPDVVNRIHEELGLLFRDNAQMLTFTDVAKLTYLPKVWKETLRKHPPGPIFARTAVEGTQLKGSGVFVPKGKTVIALTRGSHTNPEIWSNPDAFQPERWPEEGDRAPPGSYVPFSVGSRGCPGRFLADQEGLLILAEIHRRFEFILACDPRGMMSCTGWAEFTRAAANGGKFDAGLPVFVKKRSSTFR